MVSVNLNNYFILLIKIFFYRFSFCYVLGLFSLDITFIFLDKFESSLTV